MNNKYGTGARPVYFYKKDTEIYRISVYIFTRYISHYQYM